MGLSISPKTTYQLQRYIRVNRPVSRINRRRDVLFTRYDRDIRGLLDHWLRYETWGELLQQTALQPTIVAASDSDAELEVLIKDTPELSTPSVQSPPPPPPGPPLTPGAARTTEEAVVDELQVQGEEQLPLLKEDVSSSETSNPRTPSPDIELRDLSESEGAFEPISPKYECRYAIFPFLYIHSQLVYI